MPIFLRTEFETGVEPWISDGTLNGTRRIMDIYQGPDNLFVQAPQFTGFAGFAYFFFDDGTRGIELWRTDGAEAGTQLVADLIPGSEGFSPEIPAVSDERLYITGSSPDFGGQLWVIEASP